MKQLMVGLMAFSSLSFAAKDFCGEFVERIKGDKANIKVAESEVAWRAAISQSLKGGALHPTTPKREAAMKKELKPMIDEIYVVKDTPPMVLVPIEGADFEFTKKWQEYSPMVAKVTGPGVADGVLRATMLLPVSGHVGLENALAWAKADKYSLSVIDSKGKEHWIVKDVQSLDLITAQEVEIPLEANKMVSINYYRGNTSEKSGGPGGYSGGRTIEITWEK